MLCIFVFFLFEVLKFVEMKMMVKQCSARWESNFKANAIAVVCMGLGVLGTVGGILLSKITVEVIRQCNFKSDSFLT